jgi:hypothetical protein
VRTLFTAHQAAGFAGAPAVLFTMLRAGSAGRTPAGLHRFDPYLGNLGCIGGRSRESTRCRAPLFSRTQECSARTRGEGVRHVCLVVDLDCCDLDRYRVLARPCRRPEGPQLHRVLHLQPVLLPGRDHRRLPRPQSHPSPTQAPGCQLVPRAGPRHPWLSAWTIQPRRRAAGLACPDRPCPCPGGPSPCTRGGRPEASHGANGFWEI